MTVGTSNVVIFCICLLVVVAVVALIVNKTFFKQLVIKFRGRTEEVVRQDASTPDGARDYFNNAIREKETLYSNAERSYTEIAGKLDVSKIRRFVEGEAFARIRAAKQVLRELDFITALPASAVLAAQGSARPQADSAAAQARVLVQGIADIVLVFDDHIELLDYKTDRKKTEQEFLDAYRAQLELYALAIEKRFAPKPVTYQGIYSFSLNRLLEVET